MFKFLKSLFRKKEKSETGSIAKKRLQTVISRDRANISAEFLMQLKSDLVELACKYIEPDFSQVSISIERGEGGSTFLQARFPILCYKDYPAIAAV